MSLPENFKLTDLGFHTVQDAEWGVNEFPDGQIQFWVNPACLNSFKLECSLFTPRDLDLFIQIINTIKLQTVVIKYLYGARCDKDRNETIFLANLPNILAGIIEHSINPPWNTTYKIWNPHNGKLWLATYHTQEIIIPLPEELKLYDYKAVIYPDQSAYKRMGPLFPQYAAHIAAKRRNQDTGKITEYHLPNLISGKYLVVDDICDGGATFMLLGEQDPGVVMDLYITHGLFSKGVDHLKTRYRNIWCTDSCPGHKLLDGNHGTYK